MKKCTLDLIFLKLDTDNIFLVGLIFSNSLNKILRQSESIFITIKSLFTNAIRPYMHVYLQFHQASA